MARDKKTIKKHPETIGIRPLLRSLEKKEKEIFECECGEVVPFDEAEDHKTTCSGEVV